jgi:hypothetical protein
MAETLPARLRPYLVTLDEAGVRYSLLIPAGLIPAGLTLARIYARALQRLRCWSFKPFQFPAVNQPLPISIRWGHSGEGIALNRAGVSGGWPCLGRSGRLSLGPNRADDGYAHRSRGANEKILHRPAPLLHASRFRRLSKIIEWLASPTGFEPVLPP